MRVLLARSWYILSSHLCYGIPSQTTPQAYWINIEIHSDQFPHGRLKPPTLPSVVQCSNHLATVNLNKKCSGRPCKPLISSSTSFNFGIQSFHLRTKAKEVTDTKKWMRCWISTSSILSMLALIIVQITQCWCKALSRSFPISRKIHSLNAIYRYFEQM